MFQQFDRIDLQRRTNADSGPWLAGGGVPDFEVGVGWDIRADFHTIDLGEPVATGDLYFEQKYEDEDWAPLEGALGDGWVKLAEPNDTFPFDNYYQQDWLPTRIGSYLWRVRLVYWDGTWTKVASPATEVLVVGTKVAVSAVVPDGTVRALVEDDSVESAVADGTVRALVKDDAVEAKVADGTRIAVV